MEQERKTVLRSYFPKLVEYLPWLLVSSRTNRVLRGASSEKDAKRDLVSLKALEKELKQPNNYQIFHVSQIQYESRR